RLAGARSGDPHQRRTPVVEFPALAVGLRRAFVRGHAVAGFRPRGACRRAQPVCGARTPLRRDGSRGVTMSQQHLEPVGRSLSEGVLRLLFGIFLAVIAVAVTLYSAQWFAAVTVLMILFGAWEWHRMVRSPKEAAAADQQPVLIQTVITGAA